MRNSFRSLAAGLLGLAFALSPALPAAAQDDADDVRQAVARVAFLSGTASFNRGDDPDNWEEAVVNFPMTLGDRIYTGRDGRLELQAQGARIFLAPETELAALDFRDEVRQLSLTIGTASFRVNQLADGEVFEVDTPNVALTFRRPGYYRVDVDRDGNTTASIFKGAAVAAAAGGEVDLEAGDAIQVDGLDRTTYDLVALPRSDSFDRWVDERSRRLREGLSVRYASAGIVGLDDLDREGDWQQIPDYGWVWSPPVTVAGWAPYRNGRWIWQDPWGWTWISSDPWGWAPYHYGSWVTYRDRWFWVPVPRAVVSVRYAPARVVFSGGGPGWSAAADGGGFVGWFPVGPRDPFIPWWGRRPAAVVRNVNYVNQSFVTVVNRESFVGGRFVGREMVRDQKVIRQMETAPVFHGAPPILPTRESVRLSQNVEAGRALRPPRIVEGRQVVTRLAPPPAPPTFQAKMGLIAETGGAPVSRARSEKLAVESPRQGRPVQNIRPAVPDSGKVSLAPKRESVETRPVRPAERTQSAKVPPERRDFQNPPDARPAERIFDKPAERTVDRPTERTLDRPPQPAERRDVPKPEARPVEKPLVRSIERGPEKPVEKSVEKPVERKMEKPVDRGVEKPAERPPQQRREIQSVPEQRPAERPPVVREVRPEAKPEPKPVPKVEKASAPKVEKPAAKPEEAKKDKDKKDR